MEKELKECKDDSVENENIMLQVKDRFYEKIKESCEYLQAQIDELKNMRNINSHNASNFVSHEKTKIKIPIPSFKGTDQERPVTFLNELDKYIEFMKIQPTESIQIVSQTLEGVAKDWWYVYESDVQGYEQFKDIFKDRF